MWTILLSLLSATIIMGVLLIDTVVMGMYCLPELESCYGPDHLIDRYPCAAQNMGR